MGKNQDNCNSIINKIKKNNVKFFYHIKIKDSWTCHISDLFRSPWSWTSHAIFSKVKDMLLDLSLPSPLRKK